jgi:hypothetical protein
MECQVWPERAVAHLRLSPTTSIMQLIVMWWYAIFVANRTSKVIKVASERLYSFLGKKE